MKNISIIDSQGREVAQADITDVEDGWYYGTLNRECFSDDLRQALAWYDEVVSNQMLSFIDEALTAVESHQLRARMSEGNAASIFSLQVSKDGSITFRTTPVPAAASKQE